MGLLLVGVWFYLVVTSLRPSGLEQFTFVGLSISGRPCVCGNSLLQPNLQHAIERVERPGGSNEGVGRKKSDGPANGPKLRWRGPAIVVMKETSEAGPPGDIYWLAHGTTLLRAAPEHVRPATHPESDESRFMDSLDRAQLALLGICKPW